MTSSSAWLISILLVLTLSSSCKSSAKNGMPSDARIAAKEGKSEITLASRKAELPMGDVGKDAPNVIQDDLGKRLAYRTASGQSRLIYVIGQGLFIGPLVPEPADFQAAPDVDHALAPLYEAARTTTRRADLVRELHAEKGDGAVVRLLIDAAYVDDPSWEEGRKSLSEENQTAVADAMATGLDKGKSPILLRRAVALVDIRAPSRAKTVAARAKELADGTQEPRAVAALLRAVLANDPKLASSIGCEVLKTNNNNNNNSKGDDKDRASLVEAALLAIANARLTGTPSTCADQDAELAAMLTKSPCVPYLRCGSAGPLQWSDASKQDEPLCTKAQIDDAVKAEIARTNSDVQNNKSTRAELFAYGALIDSDKLPVSISSAHARRRYAITQIAEPACDSGLTPNTACHCDEPTLRAAVCRAPVDATSSANGFCKFAIDDKQKKIQDVVAGVGTP